MSIPSVSDSPSSDRGGLPRWVLLVGGLFIYVVVMPLVHGGLPWALSLLSQRQGWTEGRPDTWNLLGLVPVLIGAAGLMWILLTGLWNWDRVPERVDPKLKPPYLLVQGPYAFSRNPMYLAELALWFGWVVFYGSVAVFFGFLVLWALVAILVPREERGLERQFGADYLQYKSRVPRWLGKGRG
jgi:protein-S-isoprenylcysteine O-methyltransferase Ste14